MATKDLSSSTRVRAAQEQVSSELGREVVILQLKNGMYYGLNEVGLVIWRKLQEGSSVGQIVSTITSEFNVDPKQCEEDVLRVLSEMVTAELVTIEA